MKLSGRGRMNDGTFGTTNRILMADNSQQQGILSAIPCTSLTQTACGEQNPKQHPNTFDSGFGRHGQDLIVCYSSCRCPRVAPIKELIVTCSYTQQRVGRKQLQSCGVVINPLKTVYFVRIVEVIDQADSAGKHY